MTITNSRAVLPISAEQKAVALAFAEVIRKRNSGKKLCANPYAVAFFRHYFGTGTPAKHKLSAIVPDSSLTIPKITKSIDRFLQSNGSCRSLHLVNRFFAVKAFPCLHTHEITRSDNRVNLKMCQSNNISDKLTAYKSETKSQKIAEVTKLGNKELGRWVRENEGVLSEYDLVDGLREWFKSNNSDPFEFNYLYQDMTASRIAYDLSFDE